MKKRTLYSIIGIVVAALLIAFVVGYVDISNTDTISGIGILADNVSSSSALSIESISSYTPHTSSIIYVTFSITNYHAYSEYSISSVTLTPGFALESSTSLNAPVTPGDTGQYKLAIETPSSPYSGSLNISLSVKLSVIDVTAIDLSTSIQGLFGPSQSNVVGAGFEATPGTNSTVTLTFYNSNIISTDTITSISIETPSGIFNGSAFSSTVSPNLPQNIPAGDSLQFTIVIQLPNQSFTGSLVLLVAGTS